MKLGRTALGLGLALSIVANTPARSALTPEINVSYLLSVLSGVQDAVDNGEYLSPLVRFAMRVRLERELDEALVEFEGLVAEMKAQILIGTAKGLIADPGLARIFSSGIEGETRSIAENDDWARYVQSDPASVDVELDQVFLFLDDALRGASAPFNDTSPAGIHAQRVLRPAGKLLPLSWKISTLRFRLNRMGAPTQRGFSVEPAGNGTPSEAIARLIEPASALPPASPGDGWSSFTDIRVDKFKDDDAADSYGLMTTVTTGLARDLSDVVNAGFFFRYRNVDSTSRIFLSQFSMNFIGGGVFLQAALPQGLIFNATGSYEHGWVDAALAADTARFTVDAFSTGAKLSRPFEIAPYLWVEPALGINYSNFDAGSFVDSGGTATGNSNSEQLRLRFGASVSRSFSSIGRTVGSVELTGGLFGIWDVINGRNQTVGANTAVGSDEGFIVELGAKANFLNGASASGSFSYTDMDGGYRAYSAALNATLPLDQWALNSPLGFSTYRDKSDRATFDGSYVGISAGGASPSMQITNLISGATTGKFGTTGFAGGVMAGNNWLLGKGSVVLGLETELLLADIDGTVRPAICAAPGCSGDIEYLSMKRVRLGLPLGQIMPYATAGAAAGLVDANFNFNQGKAKLHWGFTAGGGIECRCGDGWTARIDYAYVDLAARRHTLGVIPYRVDPDAMHLVRAMLSFDLDLRLFN